MDLSALFVAAAKPAHLAAVAAAPRAQPVGGADGARPAAAAPTAGTAAAAGSGHPAWRATVAGARENAEPASHTATTSSRRNVLVALDRAEETASLAKGPAPATTVAVGARWRNTGA